MNNLECLNCGNSSFLISNIGLKCFLLCDSCNSGFSFSVKEISNLIRIYDSIRNSFKNELKSDVTDYEICKLERLE